MKPISENPIKDSKHSIPTDSVGGKKEKCEIVDKLGITSTTNQTRKRGELVSSGYEIRTNFNVGETIRPRIDDSKLIISLHVDRTKYVTQEELYHAIKKWWVDIKQRSPKTIESRIRYARSMTNHAVYPVDWLKFELEQILNQLLYRQITEYKNIAELRGKPNYEITQLNNLWKTIRTFSEAFGVDISYWGWNPPTPSEPQVKIVPRPETVNRLIHHWYSSDRYENALIRTLLTVGFQTGVRPEELIILKVKDVHFHDGYILIHEQKKKFRERQVWIDDAVTRSRQQNSLRNWVNIWRPTRINEKSGDFLFIQKDGAPFPSEDALRMYLSPFCTAVWSDFKPKIMRDWNAIGRLIRTKIETKKWDVRTVKNALGHKYEKTTESYIKFAEDYFRKDPYDWLRSVLKFHRSSLRLLRLMKQEYGPSQEKTLKILTNRKKGLIEVRRSPVDFYGPGGIRTRDLQLRKLPPNPG